MEVTSPGGVVDGASHGHQSGTNPFEYGLNLAIDGRSPHHHHQSQLPSPFYDGNSDSILLSDHHQNELYRFFQEELELEKARAYQNEFFFEKESLDSEDSGSENDNAEREFRKDLYTARIKNRECEGWLNGLVVEPTDFMRNQVTPMMNRLLSEKFFYVEVRDLYRQHMESILWSARDFSERIEREGRKVLTAAGTPPAKTRNSSAASSSSSSSSKKKGVAGSASPHRQHGNVNNNGDPKTWRRMPPKQQQQPSETPVPDDKNPPSPPAAGATAKSYSNVVHSAEIIEAMKEENVMLEKNLRESRKLFCSVFRILSDGMTSVIKDLEALKDLSRETTERCIRAETLFRQRMASRLDDVIKGSSATVVDRGALPTSIYQAISVSRKAGPHPNPAGGGTYYSPETSNVENFHDLPPPSSSSQPEVVAVVVDADAEPTGDNNVHPQPKRPSKHARRRAMKKANPAPPSSNGKQPGPAGSNP